MKTTKKNRMKLGISSCLLGEKVRYDGQHKLDPYLTRTLDQFVKWVPVCPEVKCGLPPYPERPCALRVTLSPPA